MAQQESEQERANAIDILKLSNNPLYMVTAERILHEQRLEPIRQPRRPRNPFQGEDIDLQRVLLEQGRRQPPKRRERSIYDDKQNVHTASINSSVLSIMKDLQTRYASQPNPSFLPILEQINDATTKRKVQRAYDRIMTDKARFKDGVRLHASFESVLKHIDQHPHKEELQKRLVEEMTEMSGLCATGHLSRLANTLQGFDDKPMIQIDPVDEIYAKLSHTIQQRATEDETVMDLMMDPSSPEFRQMVTTVATELQPELTTEYGKPVDSALDKAVGKYIGK